jgi:hypothetical protein
LAAVTFIAILINFWQQQARHPLAATSKAKQLVAPKRTVFSQQLPAGDLINSFLQKFPVPFSQ